MQGQRKIPSLQAKSPKVQQECIFRAEAGALAGVGDLTVDKWNFLPVSSAEADPES